MAKILKSTLLAIGLLLVTLVVAVIALPFVIDPNDFKQDFERLAAKQGIDLKLGGPISWQFYPSLGLSVDDLSVAPITQPEQTLAKAKQVTAAVALMPLFKKQIHVEKLLLDGAEIQLIVDQQGRGNWEELSNADSETDTQQTSTAESSALNLTVDAIRLSNTSLLYDDRKNNQKTSLNNLDLSISNVNLNRRESPLSLSTEVHDSTLASPLQLTLKSQIQLTEALNEFVFTEGKLALENAGLEIDFKTQLLIDPNLQYLGDFSVAISDSAALFKTFNIEKPITTDKFVLSNIKFSTTFNGTDEQFSASGFNFTLDDTIVGGSINVTFPTEQNLLSSNIRFVGDKINIDRYLAPTEETTAQTETTNIVDSPLPLENLRTINASIIVGFDEVIVNNMPITKADLVIEGNKGLWQLEALKADFYQGKLASTGQLDARQNQAAINFKASLSSLAIQPLLNDLAELDTIIGSVDMTIDATTRAATSQGIMNNLNATANFTGNSVVFKGFNLEQNYCQLVTQVDKEKKTEGSDNTASETWAKETSINNVDGQFVFSNNQLNIKKLEAQVAALLLTAKGNVNLTDESYEVSLPLRLNQSKTSETGCSVSNEFFLNREVNVIGCDGSLSTMNFANECGIRSGAVTDLAKQALRYNFDKKGGNEKVDEKKQEIRDKAKDKLKDLLNRQ